MTKVKEETTMCKFQEILVRDNSTIQIERANRITESVKDQYYTKLMELNAKVRGLQNKMEAMSDLSASNNTFDMNALKDLDGLDFVTKDYNYAIELQQAKIKLKVAKERYEYYFGMVTDIKIED